MRADNATKEETKEKAIRKTRWHRSNDGRYHYLGICPFNNAICKLMNYLIERRSGSPQEGQQ